MTWVLWALVLVVIGGCAIVAAGRGGSLAEVHDDRPDVMVPANRQFAADDLRAVRFTTAFRGYRMAEVDALIARLAAELETPVRAGRDEHQDGGPADDITSIVSQKDRDPSDRSDGWGDRAG